MANPPRQYSWLASFTGLIPLGLTLPLLVLHSWPLAIAIGIVAALIVITYHLRRGQGVTSLDVFSLGFGLTNAVLYFGFGSTVLLRRLDTVFYSLLFGQVVLAQLRGVPWTVQYARRVVAPELWATRPFMAANQLVSSCWGACFLSCALVSLAPLGMGRTLIPVALLVGMAFMTPRLSRWYGHRVATRLPQIAP